MKLWIHCAKKWFEVSEVTLNIRRLYYALQKCKSQYIRRESMLSKFIFARLKILDEKKRDIMSGKVSQDYHISSSDKSTNDDQSKIYQKNHEIENY